MNNSSNFKQISVQEYLMIPNGNIDIESINSISGYVEGVKCHTIKTMKTTSLEGQILSGNKIIIYGTLKIVVQYTACDYSQSVHSVKYNIPFTTFVVLSSNYITSNKVEIDARVENIDHNVVSCKKFFVNASIFINIKTLF